MDSITVQAKDFPNLKTMTTRGMPPTIVSCFVALMSHPLQNAIRLQACPLHFKISSLLLSPDSSVHLRRLLLEQKLKDKDEKEIDTIRVDSWSMDTIAEFFKERLA